MSEYATVCSNVDSKCVGYNSSIHTSKKPYTCTGHRKVDVTRKLFTFSPDNTDFPSYDVGDIIDAIDISSVYATLSNEVAERKKHKLYASANSPTTVVNHGDLIDDVQQTTLKTYVTYLDKLVNANAKYGDTSLGTKLVNFEAVTEGKLVEVNDVKQFNDAVSHVDSGVNALVQDCICYSDCNSYYTEQVLVCTCVTNYGCGYY